IRDRNVTGVQTCALPICSLTTEKRSDRQYQMEFRDVSFRYPGSDAWALRHVNVSFRVGSRLAVVGPNGSGKTTFIKLLCRLYDRSEERRVGKEGKCQGAT